ncbi:ABC transporter permease [Leucobacter sp. UCD-THU]|jgi:polar amino acid transport system permease protein|uniref:Amino acid ABC transporter permease n=1 Tax=Leucobacter muris TaxID=1935379 RepID=A0ABX5QCA9_9MICO|nr:MULTISPECIES: amino acid ABC transporter permease [Leucobacter]EYT54744.1 ABC transporter permease [Leucobacter sp. UCD-THU]QAB16591.1 amino acid ABC transporter permease [Leucobacter muris]
MAPPAPSREFDNAVRPLRRPGRWIGAAFLIILLVAFVQAIATNENIDFPTIGEYLFNPRILSGVQLTLVITVISMTCAALLAVIIAAMRMSGNPVLVAFAAVYVWAFRGTPLLVQIVIWGYFGLIFDKITVGVPFTDIVFFQADTNTLITALVAGIIALTLNEAAYSSEIVRSGMLSVDEGQREAAASLGMSPAYCFLKILLPQAMRVIIPPMGNQLISMIKNTSLLSLIAVLELYTQATQISAQNLRQVELLIVVSIWYLAIVSVLSVPQHYLERHFGRGSTKNQPQTLLQKAREYTGSIQVQREHKRKRKASNHV